MGKNKTKNTKQTFLEQYRRFNFPSLSLSLSVCVFLFVVTVVFLLLRPSGLWSSDGCTICHSVPWMEMHLNLDT